MKWEQAQRQAARVGAKIKQRWSKITDDDLLLLQGKQDVFVAALALRSGLMRDETEKQFDAFLSKLDLEPKPEGKFSTGFGR